MPDVSFVGAVPVGRMFPHLPAWQGVVGNIGATIGALRELADAMLDTRALDPAGDNPDIPAGFIFLAQFVGHDITLDPYPMPAYRRTSGIGRSSRVPGLELDGLYGAGPIGQPALYERSAHGRHRSRLRIGLTGGGESRDDLPRVDRDANIGDARNDENLALAQTHVAFLKFHNAVVEHLARTGVTGHRLYDEARRVVTWHYQWIVLHDFLPRIVDQDVLADVAGNRRWQTRFGARMFIPVEFSAAAFRMAHSMVRQCYDFNSSFPDATLRQLFDFSGLSENGLVPVPKSWVIDWHRFFDLDGPGSALNRARRFGPFLAPDLHVHVPEGGLAYRNLLRGLQLGLPTGQTTAIAMGITPLAAEDIATGADGAIAKAHGLHIETPLWYYILKEAECLGRRSGSCAADGGLHLGPVGSRIVAETLFGLVDADPHSFRSQAPNWRPGKMIPAAHPDRFTMVDLLRFMGAHAR